MIRNRIAGYLQNADDWLKNKGINTDSVKSGFEYGRDLSLGLVDKERHSVFEPPGKEFGYMSPEEKAGYYAGRAVGDWAGDSTRGTWWRWNHPLAITNEIGRNIGKQVFDHPASIALAGAGLATTMDLMSGNVDLSNLDEGGRPKGYSAVFASPEDPTKTEAPLAEPIARYLFGRTGKILPYEKFHEERPDVSPEAYEQYKQFQNPNNNELFGLEDLPVVGPIAGGISQLGILKGTMSNIDGEPELKAMGYRIPLSAVIGTAGVGAAVYGIGRYRKGKRIAGLQAREQKIRDWERSMYGDPD